MGNFLPQWNDNKRFLEDQVKLEILINPETKIASEIVTGLLIDGKKYREDQRDGCIYMPQTQEEADLQFLKLDVVPKEELDSLIELYNVRIQDILTFLRNHDWDGDSWQPEQQYVFKKYMPQYNDTNLFIEEQLDLFIAGLAYHTERRNWVKNANMQTPMSILQEELEAQTKIISYYTNRIRDIKDFLNPVIKN